jgi:hypothetical protein
MINSYMDIYKKDKVVTYALTTALVLLVACLSCMVYSYVKLQQAHPLENLRGAILQPVYDGDPVLEFEGTYDRYVKCNMTGFDVHLYNVDTTDIITLTHHHLAKPLPALVEPAKDIKTEFALFMPKTMYPGTWKPSFTGFYICQLGIFVDQKTQVIKPEAFIIQAATITKE